MTRIDVLDRGYVRLVDHMGDDLSSVNAVGNMQKAIVIAYTKGYRVTTDGVLIGLAGKPLPVKKRGKQRYPTFSVNVGELTSSGVFGIPVHKFAAFCFYGEESFSVECVRHIDSDTLNVSMTNIKLGSYAENEADKPNETRILSAKLARASQGYRAKNSLFSDEEVRIIRSRYETGESYQQIADSHDVTKQCIWNIVKRKNYADVA